jgi:CRP-like cAMP-binding protein
MTFFNYPGSPAAGRADDLTFLKDQSEADWAKLLAQTEMCRFRPGEMVIHEGEADRALYIVADGTLELLLPQTSRGHPRRLAAIEPGTVIGEVAFFDGRPRSAGVRAVTDCELFRLSFEAFEVLAAREPALGRAVLLDLGRILAARLRQTNAAIG